MSVRIYELSKDIGMENAELIAILKERGYQVKSASSTIDNISAESLREEFRQEKAEEPAVIEKAEEAPEKKEAPKKPDAAALVRSKEDVERERAQREAEAEAKRQSQNPPPVVPPKPGASRAGGPPPLPSGPAVTIRKPSAAPQQPLKVPTSAPSLPRGPILRTDVKEAPAKEESKPEQSSSKPAPSTPPPLVKKPAPMAPPPVSAPRPVAPPPVPSRDDASSSGDEEGDSIEVRGAAELRPLQVKTPIVVRDFAVQIGRKPFQLISDLMELGIFASMNTAIEEDIATRLASKAGFQLEVRHRGEGSVSAAPQAEVEVDESALLEPRPPIVCILGHVDHGKTTLLDTIRKANVVGGEAGGITQHIGAYQISHNEQKISFIDTPGHAAFSNMRARGANVTDIAVLVVAADDGFMPQTDEALKHIRNANLPVVVAINKIDAPGANLDKVYRQMQERNLSPEAWGGETLSAPISALKGEGINELLDAILLQAEIMETLVANPKADAEGVILEAQKEVGRGSTASVIVQRGTLRQGDALVSGEYYCRVRQILDDSGKPMKAATPGTPARVVGWSGPPSSGDRFQAVKNERLAKREAEANELERKKLEAMQRQDSGGATIEDLFAAIAKTQKKTFTVIVKADVYGTAEALATSLLGIKSDKINLNVVDMGVGAVTKNDVIMADAAKAAIIAFNVGVENGVQSIAKHKDITIYSDSIIYRLIDIVKDAMADQLEPERIESKSGAAEVRAVFPLAKGFVAGCMITEGKVLRNGLARLYRGGDLVAEATIATLRRFKDDVAEVRAGYECGVGLRGVNDYQEGDIIEVFEVKKVKPSL